MTGERERPILIMLAGPNGAGKTTFYQSFLAHLPLPFINADHLARTFNLDPYEAAEEADRVRRAFVERGQGFISETVLSDPEGAKLDFLVEAAGKGFDVHLIFISIHDVDLSVKRVEDRVRAGGHDVPKDKLLSRFERTQRNLLKACRVLPRVTIFENSSFTRPFRFVAEYRNGKRVARLD